ncbi:hypothetical protein FRC12_017711, partial [Ceratobasidium sp. 428]
EAESAELKYELERPVRQKFRRLADPGIVRDNNDADVKKAFEVRHNLSGYALARGLTIAPDIVETISKPAIRPQ